MSLHKLTAGSVYDYLTQQVTALDATDKGHVALADYYSAKGEIPRPLGWCWDGRHRRHGRRRCGHRGADARAVRRRPAPIDGGTSGRDSRRRLQHQSGGGGPAVGGPFKVYDNDVSPFRVAVAQRLEAANRADDLPADSPVPAAVRARIRTEVAAEFFNAEHGRDPVDARELPGIMAKLSRPKTYAACPSTPRSGSLSTAGRVSD
jgi:hypothetical protein